MANERKRLKELKRRYGRLAESMEPYYHHLDLRPLWELNDDGFAFLMEKVKGVNMLDLNETEITDASISLLTKLEYVKEIRVKGCRQLTDACIDDLNRIRELEFLHVKGTRITIDGLLRLTEQPNLKTLLFSDDHPELIADKIQQLLAMFPECEIALDGTPLR
ncbi:MAG: hypothetical protein ACK4E0_16220 [Chitinophagaceae bacterium]